MALIKIGDIKTLSAVELMTVTPDDRQTQVKVMDGVVVQDEGYFDSGTVYAFDGIFRVSDFSVLMSYFKKRIRVSFTDVGGVTYEDCRVIVSTWQYVRYFEAKAVKASVKIWRG